MKYFLISFGVISLGIIYFGAKIFYTIHISKEIMARTMRYRNESENFNKKLLVLGDSTAVGVGAENGSESIPGLVAKKIGATYTENYAVSGAKVESLSSQIDKVKLEHYDLILLQIGANDIVARNDVVQVSLQLETILMGLQKKTDRIIFLTAGNIGGAPAIPIFLHSYYENLTLVYHRKFEQLAEKIDVTYVNLYEDPSVDPFLKDTKKYFAKDLFHPSSAGYEYWFKKIQEKAGI